MLGFESRYLYRSLLALLISFPGCHDDPGAGAHAPPPAAAAKALKTCPTPIYMGPTKIVPADGAQGDFYGRIALQGSELAVGAHMNRVGGSQKGSVYYYTRSGSAWTQRQKITATDGSYKAWFGTWLDMHNGSMIVGASNKVTKGKSAGAAYIFTRSGTTWTQQQRILGKDTYTGDQFGGCVAIHGDTALSSATAEDARGNASGSAYIFTRSGTTWTQEAKLTASDGAAGDRFGWQADLEGDTAVVGSRYNSSVGTQAGAAYVYMRSGTSWTQTQKLTASDGKGMDHFGMTVSLDGADLLIGAFAGDNGVAAKDSGSAYVFTRSGTTWSEQAKLTSPDASYADYFAYRGSIKGGIAAVGAFYEDATAKDAGAIYVYKRSGTTWTFSQRLLAPDGATKDRLVEVEHDGKLLVAGSIYNYAGGKRTGAIYTYPAGCPKKNGEKCSAATDCQSGFCVDGVCCDKKCGGTVLTDCQACSKAAGAAVDGTCGAASASIVCRAAAGLCDAAETCTGASTTCPVDAFKTGGVCRAAAGLCDAAESCSGSSAACPADSLKAANSVCRAAADLCDAAETCTGTSALCPKDMFKGTAAVCRPEAGGCDLSENCTGASAQCPKDSFRPVNAVCRPGVGACDISETCTGSSALCPKDAVKGAATTCRAAVGLCDLAEACDGASGHCPADAYKGVGTGCRAAAGLCDAAEVCTGASTACPADAFKGSGSVCRSAAGLCDAAETCTGASTKCPADVYKSASTTCRAAAGPCDQAELCSGTSIACPGNSFKSAATTCRAAIDVCDEAEKCTGASGQCPADNFKSSTTVCRASCCPCDLPELCSGISTLCPTNKHLPNGTPCTGGKCKGGKCVLTPDAGPPPDMALDAAPDLAADAAPEAGQDTGPDITGPDLDTGAADAAEDQDTGAADAAGDLPAQDLAEDLAAADLPAADKAPSTDSVAAPDAAGDITGDEDTGCNCQASPAPGGGAGALLLLGMMILMRRRRVSP